MEPSHMKRFE